MKVSLILPALMLLACLPSCTTSVLVEGSLPTPRVTPIPARVGVFYPDHFRHFRHEEKIEGAGNWRIDLGRQNHAFFKKLLEGLFISVKEVTEPPVSREEMQNLDGVLIPGVDRYGFLTPAISGLQFYSASIEYRITLLDKSGDTVGDWNIVGYGKSEGGMFGADDALGEATMLAIRDGGARVAIELGERPEVQAWLGSISRLEPGGTAAGAADEGKEKEESNL